MPVIFMNSLPKSFRMWRCLFGSLISGFGGCFLSCSLATNLGCDLYLSLHEITSPYFQQHFFPNKIMGAKVLTKRFSRMPTVIRAQNNYWGPKLFPHVLGIQACLYFCCFLLINNIIMFKYFLGGSPTRFCFGATVGYTKLGFLGFSILMGTPKFRWNNDTNIVH